MAQGVIVLGRGINLAPALIFKLGGAGDCRIKLIVVYAPNVQTKRGYCNFTTPLLARDQNTLLSYLNHKSSRTQITSVFSKALSRDIALAVLTCPWLHYWYAWCGTFEPS